ncbi:hypothetical protein [Methylophaga sp. OBS3]|uniref:hypothetical protein n=1 Tax=Methylophaga sp. OBS3 TaxID=2991934 RepID=UPI002257750F|nr:hypothetical protein [Methylophaga sp. OBS3]MCX4190009.1 hypothetical protein [Methylophaga sp. OBS3]
MLYMLLVVAILLAFMLGMLFWQRQQRKTILSTSPKPPSKHFHGVSITPSAGACRAAQAIANKRFLSSDAPVLPLTDCDTAYCGCRYEHHQDRRGPINRRQKHVEIETQSNENDHRQTPERRHGLR